MLSGLGTVRDVRKENETKNQHQGFGGNGSTSYSILQCFVAFESLWCGSGKVRKMNMRRIH